MSLREHVYSVLIVSSNENFSASLTDFMPVGNFSPVSTATSVSEAKRRLQDRKFDFVIINSPLPDDFGSKLATDISAASQSGVLLLVRNEIYEGVYEKVTDSGVITLSKPVSKAVMTEVLRIMGAVRERLRALERKTSTVTNFNDTDGTQYLQRIHYIEEIRSGELLVCSHAGAHLYNISEDGIRPAGENGSRFAVSDCGMIYSFLQDREGNLWFGSMYDGVEFRPAQNNFVSYMVPENADTDIAMSSICELEDGRYLLGTWNSGILLFDENRRTVSPQVRTYGIWTAVLSMLVEDRTLWIATFRQGIKKVDLDTGSVQSYLSDPADPNSRVFVLFRSANGRIWAGTSVGLYYYDRRSDRFIEQFAIQRISAITEDHQGKLWIATTGNGLYAYDVRTGNLDTYRHDRNNPASRYLRMATGSGYPRATAFPHSIRKMGRSNTILIREA